jgi:hypothetical protein
MGGPWEMTGPAKPSLSKADVRTSAASTVGSGEAAGLSVASFFRMAFDQPAILRAIARRRALPRLRSVETD